MLDDIKGQLGSLGKQLGQSMLDESKKAAQTAVNQIGFEVKEGEKKAEVPNMPPNPNQAPPPVEMANKAKENNADFVNELYGAAPKKKQEPQAQNPQVATAQKMMALRQKLHSEYYQRLTTPPKKPEEAQVEQERAAERMERLEMEDVQKKKKAEEKKKPIAVVQAERKTEAPMGAG